MNLGMTRRALALGVGAAAALPSLARATVFPVAPPTGPGSCPATAAT